MGQPGVGALIPLLSIPPPSPSAFDAAVSLVIQLEGGGAIVNDPRDRGGLTRWGISKAAHPDVDIENLDLDGARAIYRERYWGLIHGDELPPALALAVMDWAVHSGPDAAVRELQRALKVAVDGKVGPQTIAAARLARWCLVETLIARRLGTIDAICAVKPSQQVFAFGWRLRCLKLHRACIQWAREAAR